MRSRLAIMSLAAASVFGIVSTSLAGNDVKLIVLKEHGVGSAAQAQPYVDKLVAIAAKLQGWSSGTGVYKSDRSSGQSYISSEKPQYGILSLGAYLALHDSEKLEAIGSVSVSHGGGQQYFLVSKDASDLSGCKGDKLATDMADDSRFVDRVISGGSFKLSEFTVNGTKRPLQSVKAVINGDAKCALIDDAQFAELSHLDGGDGLKSVWKSASLPPMAVVAFPSATDKGSFKKNLSQLCDGDGKQACNEVAIQSLREASESDYSSVLSAYGKP